MKTVGKTISMILSFLFILTAGVSARDSGEFTETFPVKSSIKFDAVSGDCHIIKGDSDKITVTYEYSYSPSNSFEPVLEVRGEKLILREILHGSCSGSSRWTIAIPDKIRVSFSTASGSLKAEGVEIDLNCSTASGDIILDDMKGIFSVQTASGDIRLENFSGEISGSTASGDIEVKKAAGDIDLQTASGSVDVREIKGTINLESASGNIDVTGAVVEDRSYFGTASGNVYVVLGAGPADNIDVASASGDAVLNYNGFPIKGFFEFITMVDRGDINSPIKFDKVEEYRRHGEDYVRKTFEKDGKIPSISITTASGKATLEER